jgi:hypothetical protein
VESIWPSFRLDPRDPAHRALRASDADRALVSSVLADAYADGRLTAEEYDERESANLAAKTLGELPPLMADLVGPVGQSPARVTIKSPGQMRRQATRDQIGDVIGIAVASSTPFVICIIIWLLSGDGFSDFWPKWALIPTLLATGPAILGSRASIRSKVRRMEKKQNEQLQMPPSASGATEPPELG